MTLALTQKYRTILWKREWSALQHLKESHTIRLKTVRLLSRKFLTISALVVTVYAARFNVQKFYLPSSIAVFLNLCKTAAL